MNEISGSNIFSMHIRLFGIFSGVEDSEESKEREDE